MNVYSWAKAAARGCRSYPVIMNVLGRRYHIAGFSSRSFSMVKIVFIEEANGKIIPVNAKIGEKVVDVAIANDIDIEAACGGELACSTCHVIVPQKYYDKLPPVTDAEQDMLDLAWGLTDRSRLCCQIVVTPELEGCEFTVPAETHNQTPLKSL